MPTALLISAQLGFHHKQKNFEANNVVFVQFVKQKSICRGLPLNPNTWNSAGILVGY